MIKILNKNKKTGTIGFGGNLAKQSGDKGFTLIEILIVVGIIMFLSGSMLQIATVSNTHKGVVLGAEKVKSALRMAQAYSLSIPQDSTMKHVCGFGVYPSGSKVTVYYLYNDDYDNDPSACNNSGGLDYSTSGSIRKVDEKIFDLETGYSVSGHDIFFKAPYSQVHYDGASLGGNDTAEQTVTDGSQSTKVLVNGGGKINIQ